MIQKRIKTIATTAVLSVTPLVASADTVEIPNPIKFESINEFFVALTSFLMQIGLALVVFMIVLGGFYIMISGGRPEQFEKGKNIIKWTVLGLFVLLLARAILALIYYVLGA